MDIKLNGNDCAIVFREAGDHDEVYVGRPEGSKDSDPLPANAARLHDLLAGHAVLRALLAGVRAIAKNTDCENTRCFAGKLLDAAASVGVGAGSEQRPSGPLN